MIEGKKVLAIIPARGGSKGIKRKNLKELGDKPLIAWSIDHAINSKYIDYFIVSTDDDEIAEVAKHYRSAVIFRPHSLASDDASVIDCIVHAVELLEPYDIIALLQPTSPFRTFQDIDRCLELLVQSEDVPAVVSLTEPSKSPYWTYKLVENKLVSLIEEDTNVPRQKLTETFVLNGAVYVANTEWLINNRSFISENTMGYKMPWEKSVDIDTEFDLWLCRKMLEDSII